METELASGVVRDSLVNLWLAIAAFLPKMIAATIVFIIGWLIALLLGRFAYHIIRILHIDDALSRIGFRRAWERSGFSLNSAYFFEELVKWFFIIVSLMASTNILGLTEITDFLKTVVFYLPNVIVAAIILLIGILVAKFLEGTVSASIRAAGLASANFLGGATRWAVLVFTLLISLSQLGVATEIIRIVIWGFVASGAIAIGLAFGLGGVRHADEFIAGLKKKIGE
jgi:hypothetical protein